MSFVIHCPQCKIELEAEEQYRGMEVNCPSCGALIAIPNVLKPNTAKVKISKVVERLCWNSKKIGAYFLHFSLRQVMLMIAIVGALLIFEYLIFGQVAFGILKESRQSQSNKIYWEKGYEAARTMMFSEIDATNKKDYLLRHFQLSCKDICPRRLDDVYAFTDGYYYSISKEVKGNSLPKSEFMSMAKYTWGSPR